MLGFLPGAWLGFSVPDRRIPWHVAAALSVALGPAVLAAEVVLLSVVGQPFSHSVYILCILNLPALAVIATRVRRLATDLASSPNTAPLLAPLLWCFGLLIAYPLAAWLEVPGLRVYSSHNMMQLDACYQVANLPAIPQEWDLAGLRLNYGWLGLIQLTAISRFLDCSPTLVFPWLSALQLLALVVLVNETARQFIPDHPFLTASTVAVILLGTNLVGAASLLSYGPSFLQGEMRTTAFIGKYFGIDTMVIGLSLAAGLVYTITLGATITIVRVWLLVPLLLVGIGLCYPLLLPSTLVLCGLYGWFLWRELAWRLRDTLE